MPNKRHSFDVFRGRLSSWLRNNMQTVTSLPAAALQLYSGKGIVTGWSVKPPDSEFSLRILLDDGFPFTHIKIALEGQCRHLIWPHVEEQGYLCLPVTGWRPIENLQFSAQQRINLALKLFNNCQADEYIKDESSLEFLSYWGRAAKLNIHSLLDLSKQKTRKITLIKAKDFWLVGDDKDQVHSWLSKNGKLADTTTHQALFSYLDEPPSLPFTQGSKQFLGWVLKRCPELINLTKHLSPFKNVLFVLAVKSERGVGVIAAQLSAISQRGFRKHRLNSIKQRNYAQIVKGSWYLPSQLTLAGITRVDGAWVHGRGLNQHYQTLVSSNVVVLGCGSLGSQVAARLAQSGVGHISLVDAELLEANNIGRHALGIDSLAQSKAKALENLLLRKYPHNSFRSYPCTFQQIITEVPRLFKEADLIISCIAETDQDLFWDSWYRAEQIKAPVIYGWIGTQGTTGHALALTFNGPALSCFFDVDGFLLSPDTNFSGDTQVQVEPGCGTEFQPYGPLAAGQAELLVTRLSLDILTEKTSPPHHRVFACSTQNLLELGGEWTESHLAYRAKDYDGPFEYQPSVEFCGICYQCKAQ